MTSQCCVGDSVLCLDMVDDDRMILRECNGFAKERVLNLLDDEKDIELVAPGCELDSDEETDVKISNSSRVLNGCEVVLEPTWLKDVDEEEKGADVIDLPLIVLY